MPNPDGVLGYRCPTCGTLQATRDSHVGVRPQPGVIWWCCDDTCAAESGYPQLHATCDNGCMEAQATGTPENYCAGACVWAEREKEDTSRCWGCGGDIDEGPHGPDACV